MKTASAKKASALSPVLRKLIRQTMFALGDCYSDSFGKALHQRLLKIRTDMTELRKAPIQKQVSQLNKLYRQLQGLSSRDQILLAKGFALMMEVTNLCENAYRAHRWREKKLKITAVSGSSIIFVLTAHPTESRSPQTVLLMQKLQHLLTNTLSKDWESYEAEIRSLLSMIVCMEIAPREKPQPQDEAHYIYQTVLSQDWLDAISSNHELVDIFRLRTWVGGDKDGHPGVDEKVMLASLEGSRLKLLEYIEKQLGLWAELAYLKSPSDYKGVANLLQNIKVLKKIKAFDAREVTKFQQELKAYFSSIKPQGAHLPFSTKIESIFKVFPALVIPLEIRESSDVLHECLGSSQPEQFAIYRMIKNLSSLSSDSGVRDYARSFIVSMTHSAKDLRAAQSLVEKVFRDPLLPVVPLFETKDALDAGPEIIAEFLQRNSAYTKNLRTKWNNSYEVMLGYSDSSKQSGGLSGRVSIRGAMSDLESKLPKLGVSPLFFHGSGGSVARGGGNLEEQTAGWSAVALNQYKATIQGEIVSRTFAEPEIFLSQIEKISQVQKSKRKVKNPIFPSLEKWAQKSSVIYEQTVSNPEFLKLVSTATLYPYLHELKIGSRPSKRKSLGGIQDLRAIPWVMCWTQVRVLFLNWWGLSQSWSQLDSADKKKILAEYRRGNPFLLAFMKQLGFSLAKVNLAVWHMYLNHLGQRKDEFSKWQKEFASTLKMYQEITGQKNLLWFRPWLDESIYIRTPLIHPLNLLQIIALKKQDMTLLRVTVTGIASGMLTTG